MRRLIEAIDDENWAMLEQLFSPQIVYEVPGREPIRGLEQLMHYYRVQRRLSSGQHDIHGIMSDDIYAVAWGHFGATTENGESIDVRFVDHCRFDGELIHRRTVYFFAEPPQGFDVASKPASPE